MRRAMRFRLILAALAACVVLAPAQTNEFAFTAVGNFNPTTVDTLGDGTLIANHNKNSLGGGFEYRHYFGKGIALGANYVQNPSDGRLLVNNVQAFYWPAMHYDLAVLASKRLRGGRKLDYFISAGPAVFMTNGGKSESGWSADPAVEEGAGMDYRVAPHLYLRSAMSFLQVSTGCYDDHACRKSSVGISQDMKFGFVLK